jgi:formate-nitrite transporter family protein
MKWKWGWSVPLPSKTSDSKTVAEKVSSSPEGLSREEVKQVKEARRPRAAVVYEIVRTEGEAELIRPFSALWWSGVAAGISIGFSFLSEAALAAHLPASDWRPIIAKLGYAVGFLIVILGRQQLFTENVLTAVLPVISRRKLDWLLSMVRLWSIVLAANVAGCFVFALALSALPIVGADVSRELGEIVAHLMQNSPTEMFAKGIGAGWIIAALVWILASSDDLHFFVIGLLTYLIALFGFTHIVAGSVEAIYGVLVGVISPWQAFGVFFLPTLAGNIFGGTVLFSVLSYAQVREEISASKRGRR